MSTHARRLRACACSATLTILLALGLGAATAAAAPRCHRSTAAPGSALRSVQAAVICQINRQRRAHGLRPVAAHPRLTRLARGYARSMVRLRFFSHNGPGGVTLLDRVRAAGYGGGRIAAGGAPAGGGGRLAPPRAIVRTWMPSPPHRAVLLRRGYRDVGIGVALGTPY